MFRGNHKLADYFLWPKPKIKFNKIFNFYRIKISEIEREISRYYNNLAFPVLVSSGRVGIKICLIYLKQNNKNNVKIFNYASQCVVKSVLKIAKPVFISNNTKEIQVIFHHMSCVQNQKTNEIFIEDTIDTLAFPNAKLFPLNGLFEIWSLEKIYGLIGGGIIWCKDKKTSESIKKIVNENKRNFDYIWILRILSIFSKSIRKIWDKKEIENFSIPWWAINQFEPSFLHDKNELINRQKKYKLLASFLPNWYLVDNKRLPSSVPIIIDDYKAKLIKSLGFKTDFRHFEIFSKSGSTFIKFFPIPIHYQVPINKLEEVIRILKK